MLQRFLQLVHAHPGAPALVDGSTGAVTTRAALLARANGLAAELRAGGLSAGESVALQLPNSTDFVATVLAALDAGLILFAIDRDATEQEVATILGHFEIGGLVYSPDRRTTTFTVRHGSRLALPPGAFLVKLTSGSTGRPKGIVTTFASLSADCENICRSMQIAPGDINLGAIPFSHSYGFSNLVMPLILQGTPIVVSNDYLPQALVDQSNRHRCTVAPLIPMVFEHLITTAHGEFETVRTFLSAGAPLQPATSRRFRERFGSPIHSFYGCSECGGITYDRRGGAVERGTVGSALDGVELIEQEGRLSVRSDAVAAGYLLEADSFEPFEGGVFRTDDLVELQESELALTGRASDVINAAGKKVNPREVEAVILQIDGVREVKVYGEPAGARGEVVAAAVVGTPELSREQIRQFCRARLSLHKVPRIVKLLDRMPLDERGKVKRAALLAVQGR
jgi:acyl-CoA synthetase (AMP-forming)/AMP-acid ligase II